MPENSQNTQISLEDSSFQSGQIPPENGPENNRENLVRQAEITTQYDPMFAKIYLFFAVSLIAFSISVLILRFKAPCSTPLATWLLINTILSIIYTGISTYDILTFSNRYITQKIIAAFKTLFIFVWIFAQMYLFNSSPSTCDPLLWGTCLALVVLEYARIIFPILLILTIWLWYPLLERFLENFPNKGLSKEAIATLPIELAKQEDAKCAICISQIKDGDEMRGLPCSHPFHRTCIDSWLTIKNICPLCREVIIIENFEIV